MNKRPHENGADDLAAKRLKRFITIILASSMTDKMCFAVNP